MASELTFEVGNRYLTAEGEVVELITVRPTYMLGEIKGKPILWNTNGRYIATPTGLDLVAEWKEPARVMVRVYRAGSGVIQCWIAGTEPDSLPPYWHLIAQREIVEGEGME